MARNIFILLCAALMIWSGYKVGWQQDLSAVHRYHYTFVMEKDIPAFCRGLGTGECIMGGGMASFPLLDFVSSPDLDILSFIAILGGFVYIIFTVIKYNGKLF